MLSEHALAFYSLLPVAGFVVGIFGSFTGLGGTFILIPLLVAVFGLPYNTAIGCTLAQMVGMALSGLMRHYRLGHIDKRLALNFLAGSIPAAILGRLTLQWLTRIYGMEGNLKLGFHIFYTLLFLFAASTLIVKLIWFLRKAHKEKIRKPWLHGRKSRVAAVFAGGSLAGFLSGLLAIGGGIVTLPVLSGPLGVPIQTAVGTSVCQMVPMAMAATIVSFGTTDLDWAVIGLLLVGSMPGASLGPWLLNRTISRLDGP